MSARQTREPRGTPLARPPRKGVGYWLLRVFFAALLLAIIVAAIGYWNAIATPTKRQLNLTVNPYAAHLPGAKLILLSDIHVHGPDMPPARLEKIVETINEEHPDVIVIAGDFIGNNLFGANYSLEDSVAPLAHLHSRFGVYAVLGNNDHVVGRKKVAKALKAVNVHVLNNQAVIAGPIDLGGAYYRLDTTPQKAVKAVYATLERMQGLPGIKVLAAHTPDVFPAVPASVSLVLAGHTHCGQIALPFVGPLLTGSRYHFVCGLYRRGKTVLVVTGGLGTSHVPLRYGAPPDFWVINIEGQQDAVSKSSPKGK